MYERQRAPGQDQTAFRRLCKDRHGALDLGGVTYVEWRQLDAERRCNRLDRSQLADTSGYGGIADDCNPGHARRDLLKQFQPFPAGAVFEQEEPGGVAAGPRHTVDVPGPDRVGNACEHDRHGASRLQQDAHGGVPPARMTSGASATNSAAAPPSNVMNLRRLIQSPRRMRSA